MKLQHEILLEQTDDDSQTQLICISQPDIVTLDQPKSLVWNMALFIQPIADNVFKKKSFG